MSGEAARPSLDGFPAFPDHTWQALAAYLQPVNCQAGVLLFAEGDATDGLYFLVGGKFAVQKKGELPGRMQTVALLSGGSVAGEGALAGIATRRASLLCLEAGVVLRLSLADHAHLRDENPRLCLTLLHFLLRISSLRLGCCSDRLAVLL